MIHATIYSKEGELLYQGKYIDSREELQQLLGKNIQQEIYEKIKVSSAKTATWRWHSQGKLAFLTESELPHVVKVIDLLNT